MSTAPDVCAACVLITALTDGAVERCPGCVRAARPRPPPARPLAPLPAPSPPDVREHSRLDAPDGPRSAERDLAALARHPRLRAQCLEPVRAATLSDNELRALAEALGDDPDARDVARERDLYRAYWARARLATMAAPTRRVPVLDAEGAQVLDGDGRPVWRTVPNPDGRRYAAIVWTWFGLWGERLRSYVSAVEELARVYGTRAEREAWRAHFERKQIKAGQVDAVAARAYANALHAAAIAAYEHDCWTGAGPGEAAAPRTADDGEKGATG